MENKRKKTKEENERLKVLREENFFENNIVYNSQTGMRITISPKDIRETLGNGNKFQRLPRELKVYKVVTIRSIKELLRRAHLQEDDVENIHFGETDKFAYYRKTIMVDSKQIVIRISVKKKEGSNHFHIHHIDVNEKNPELLGPSRKTDILETQDYNKTLTDV